MDTSATAPARATLAQVAERAGVSLKTASRALSGETYVAETTRERVVSAAVELGSQRNSAASLLASAVQIRAALSGIAVGRLRSRLGTGWVRSVHGSSQVTWITFTVTSSTPPTSREPCN